MGVDLFGFAYAATVAAGGIIGYVKAPSVQSERKIDDYWHKKLYFLTESVPSLAAGLVFGGLLGYGAYQVSQNANNIFLPLGTSIFLTTLMGYRFMNSGKIMPAGLIAGVSLLNVVRLSYRIAVPVRENVEK